MAPTWIFRGDDVPAQVEADLWALTSGGRYGACEQGSRWRRYALTTDDVGRTLAINEDGSMTIDGADRCDATDAFMEYAGQNGTVCGVVERLDGVVTVGPDGCAVTIDLPNPPLAFARTPAPSLQLGSVVALAAIQHVEDAGLLEEDDEECDAPPYFRRADIPRTGFAAAPRPSTRIFRGDRCRASGTRTTGRSFCIAA